MRLTKQQLWIGGVAAAVIAGTVVAAIAIPNANDSPSANPLSTPAGTAIVTEEPATPTTDTPTATPAPTAAPDPGTDAGDLPVGIPDSTDGIGVEGYDTSGWVSMSPESRQRIEREVEKVASEWTTFDTHEGQQRRTERLSQWLDGDNITSPPLMSREEYRRTKNHDMVGWVKVKNAQTLTESSPSKGLETEGYTGFDVRVEFTAKWNIEGGQPTNCIGWIDYKMSVPVTLNNTGTDIVQDASRKMRIEEPDSHPCL